MRILFICGSLEPGRNGVGDYTVRLAQAMEGLGNKIAVIAASDSHVQNKVEDFDNNKSIRTLRIPKAFKNKFRFEEIDAFITSFNPDCISLQYVVFSFHDKGLPFLFNRHLAKRIKRYRVHIMFHELWLGINEKRTFKYALWGSVQRFIIYNLTKGLRPVQINTSTNLYKSKLSELGIRAGILPLFSNIPVCKVDANNLSSDSSLNLVLFGTIRQGVAVDRFAREVAAYSIENKRNVVLNFIGRCGVEQDRWIALWTAVNLEVRIWGEQSEFSISSILSGASMGLTTTHVGSLEKSGSVAAMREHGLPILCLSSEMDVAGENFDTLPAGIMRYVEGSFKKNVLQPRYFFENDVNSVANTLFRLLKDN